jgi:hypothetical protein
MKPSIGRIVHYVLTAEDSPHHPGDHRPAIVVRVWSEDCVNLRVFCDGGNDRPDGQDLWITSATLDASAAAGGTWHWPEREE